jgi:hypothetical protein
MFCNSIFHHHGKIVNERYVQTTGFSTNLEQIIMNHVLPGTKIITDAWRGHNNVGQLGQDMFKQRALLQIWNKS